MRRDDTPFSELTSFATATLGGKFTSRCTWSGSPLNSTRSVSKSEHTASMISSMRVRCRSPNTGCRNFVTKTKCACMRKQQCLPVRMSALSPINQHDTVLSVQLRYNFRLYPTPGQRASLARAFGCARVVFNDALALRRKARDAGDPFPKTGDLSKSLITEAKRTPE